MVSAMLSRPSLSVVACVVVVTATFIWRGDLRLDGEPAGTAAKTSTSIASAPSQAAPTAAPQSRPVPPVVVRRTDAAAKVKTTRRTGRVVDALGFLLVGAEVNRRDAAPLRTNGDGAFVAEFVEGKITDLTVRADGRRASLVRATPHSPDPLWLCLEPAAPWDEPAAAPSSSNELRAEGIVRDVDGSPLAFAFVNVGGTDIWAKSNDLGQISVPLVGIETSFLVQRDGTAGVGGLASLSGVFTSPRAQGVVPMPDLVAAAGGTLRGIVRDARGEPVAGLAVEVLGQGVRRIAETGLGGAFSVGGLVPDDYRVRPFPHRGAVGAAQHVRIDRAVVGCDLHLERVEERPLHVVDEQGAAVAGAWVVSNLHGLRRGVGQTDAAGRVSLPLASACEFEVRTDTGEAFAVQQLRRVDVDADPATLVVAP